MQMYLPDNCYRDAPLTPEAIVIHYFSCINVDANNPFGLSNCFALMVDLNLPKENRIQFLLGEVDYDKRLYASAHCFIDRYGVLALTVPENKQAYHAGKSDYAGRTDWNRFSYGIELIGSAHSGFTDDQYETCANHCAKLVKEYDIPMDMIVGHEEIATPYGRKVDPGIATGNFDMSRLKQMIETKLEENHVA